MAELDLQPGLFGATSLPGTHVVAAHSRMLADGTTTFVAEHLRWNRGRTQRTRLPRVPARPTPVEDPDQLGLFETE